MFRWSLSDSSCTSCSLGGGHPLEVGDISITSEVTLGTELCFLLVQQQEIFFLFLWLTATLWLVSYKVPLSPPSCRDFNRAWLWCLHPNRAIKHKGLEKISPFMGLNTESLQQHPLHLKGNFVVVCKLVSCNQWILVASYLQLFKEARFLGYVFSLEKCKPKSALFLTCFFHLETKVKKWENEKTCSVTTEMWNKTLRIT